LKTACLWSFCLSTVEKRLEHFASLKMGSSSMKRYSTDVKYDVQPLSTKCENHHRITLKIGSKLTDSLED
jgi:hypothetical protein